MPATMSLRDDAPPVGAHDTDSRLQNLVNGTEGLFRPFATRSGIVWFGFRVSLRQSIVAIDQRLKGLMRAVDIFMSGTRDSWSVAATPVALPTTEP